MRSAMSSFSNDVSFALPAERFVISSLIFSISAGEIRRCRVTPSA